MFEEIVEKLYFKNPPELIEEGRKELFEEIEKMSDLELATVIDDTPFLYRDETVNVLSKLGYPRIKHAIPSLLDFFGDLNYPGANEALVLLRSLDFNVYKDEFHRHLKRAYDTNDGDWASHLMSFVDRYELEDSFDPDLIKEIRILVKRYEEQ